MQINPSVQINRTTDATGSNQNTRGTITPFSGLSQGDRIIVEVVEVNSGQLVLRTPNGETINAQVSANVGLMPGDTLELMMESKGSGQISLSLASVNGQSVNLEAGELQVKLMDLGVQPSQANTSAAAYLVDRGMVPTGDRIAMLISIAEQFPETPSNIAFFMVANKIPVTQENINILLQWLNDPQPLADKTAQLATILTQIAPQGVEQQNSFLQAFFDQTAQSQAGSLPQGFFQADDTIGLATRLFGMSDGQARIEIAQFLSEQTQLTPQQRTEAAQVLFDAFKAGGAASVAVTADAQPLEGQTAQPAQMAQGQPAAAPLTDGQGQVVQPQPEGQAQAAVQQPSVNQAQAPQPQATEVLPSAQEQTQQQSAAVQQGISSAGEAVQQNAAVSEQTGQAMQVSGQDVAQQPATVPLTNEQQAAIAKELQQIVGELTKFTVPIRRNVFADAESLQQALKGQQDLADNVRSGIARLAGESGFLTQKAGDVSAQIRMGNQLDNFFYCQVPFEIAQQKNTAELYVFERKKEGQAEGEERTRTTVLIALDTEYMGRVETVLRSEYEYLSLEFRVENERVRSYLDGEMDELRQEMGDEEFTIREIRVVKMNERITPMNAMQIIEEEEPFSLQTVDIQI